MADTTLLLQKSYTLIQQATMNDRSGNYSEALRLYLTGLEGFISALRVEKNQRVKDTLKTKMNEYMLRAEQLKDILKKGYVMPASNACHDCDTPAATTIKSTRLPNTPSAPPQYHPTPTDTELILPSVPTFNPLPTLPSPPPYNPSATLSSTTSSSSSSTSFISSKKILNGQIGCSYDSLFGEYLTIGTITWIRIEDPYIRTRHQIDNLIKLLELVVEKCTFKNDLKVGTTLNHSERAHLSKIKIDLITSSENQQQEDELKLVFYQIKDSMTPYNIAFNYQFSTTIHDRLIECSNGYQIKLGRGLDIYQKLNNNGSFSPIGSYNQNLRQCLENTIDILKK